MLGINTPNQFHKHSNILNTKTLHKRNLFWSNPELWSNGRRKLEGKFFEVDSTHFRFVTTYVLLQTPYGYVTVKTSQMVHSYIKCEW